jgi:hypothetical protein
MDGRGRHGHHAHGAAHPRWRGGHPTPDPAKRRANAKASAARHPERRRAREQVKNAVRRGALAPVKTLACKDCGQPAQAYDHCKGYDHPLEVEPVCYKCHGKRAKARGEYLRA